MGWRPPDSRLSANDESLLDSSLLKGTQFQNLLEFGRAVHAEMSALSEAAHRSISVRDGTLYSTTFPCHLCARHIIAAVLRRVIYIEPCPKSLARMLYEDMIEVDPRANRNDRVTFEPIVGVAPSIYAEMFRASERKDADGNALPWINQSAEPKLKQFTSSYLFFEDEMLAFLSAALARAGITSSIIDS